MLDAILKTCLVKKKKNDTFSSNICVSNPVCEGALRDKVCVRAFIEVSVSAL